MNRSTRFAAAVALAAAVAPTADAAAKSSPPARCPHMTGTVVLSAPRVKVVRRRNADGLDVLFGCTRPNGRVRRLGTAPDEGPGYSSIDAVRAVGTWVRIDLAGSDQYHVERASWLIDVTTARGYAVLSYAAENADPSPGPSLDALLWDARGRSVTAIGTPTSPDAGGTPTASDEAIAVHAPDGTTVTLDHGAPSSVPPASVTLSGGVVGWTHDGQARSVTFS